MTFLFLAVSLHTVLNWMNRGGIGYGVLFGLLFFCGLGLPVPEDIPLICSGILIGAKQMSWGIAAPLAWAGIIGGDCMLYMLGHKYGMNITRVPMVGKHVTTERIEKAERLFEKYGIWVVAVGRLFAGVRGAMVVAAGTIRFNFIKFIIADSIAAIISGGMFMLLGFFIGNHIDKIEHYKSYIAWGIAIAAVLIIAYLFLHRKRKPDVGFDVVMKSAEKLDPQRPAAPADPMP